MLSGKPPQRFWHEEKFREVIQTIPRPGTSLLDVGCAAGSLTYLAAAIRPDLCVTAVDISSAQIGYANAHIAPKIPNAKFLAIEPGRLPFADESFDTVTSVELIEHLRESENAELMSEVFRVLRPGGSWIITTPNYRSIWPLLEVALNIWSPVKYNEQHLTRFHRASLRRHLEDVGWQVNELRTFFVLSPFFAWVSRKAAARVHRLEKALSIPGNLLIARATKPPKASQL